MAAEGSENEKFTEQSLESSTGDSDVAIEVSDPDVVLVDFEENDPKNPLNWSSTHKWLIVFAISWMGFVRYASFVSHQSLYVLTKLVSFQQ